MTLITTLLEIDAIEYTIPPGFAVNSAKIDQLAQAFLAAKGSINPILVREITPIQFALIEGYTEMLAAVRASEIDRNFTEIRAIVVPPEILPSVQAQVELLRRDLPLGQGSAAVEGMQLDAVLKAIARLEKSHQEQIQGLAAVIEQRVQPPAPTPATSRLLADFNQLSEGDLVRKLDKIKNSKHHPELARAIVQERETGGPFTSLSNVAKRFQGTKRLGDKTLLGLLDTWG
ncbi:MAG: hypothetical protein SNJ60_00400 [Pseudanabaenaceae cyanobacterium]